MIERTWYYYQNSIQEGPITESALRSLIAKGTLPQDVLVWCTELGEEWHPAAEMEPFQHLGSISSDFESDRSPIGEPEAPPEASSRSFSTPTLYQTPIPGQQTAQPPSYVQPPKTLSPTPQQSQPSVIRTDANAKLARNGCILGFVSLLCGVFTLVPAIIMAHVARARGERNAVTALTLFCGYTLLIILIFGIVAKMEQ